MLKQALRSDYPRLIGGDEIRERVEALTALAEGGKLDQAYVAELSRRANAMPNADGGRDDRRRGRASGQRTSASSAVWPRRMWGRVQILSRDGRQVYAGLAGESANPIILPSETRSLAEMTRAAALATPSDPRLAVLRDGLMRLGAGRRLGQHQRQRRRRAGAGCGVEQAVRRSAGDADSQPAATETLTLNGATPVRRRGFAQAGDVT